MFASDVIAAAPNPWVLGLGLALVALASWGACGVTLRLLVAWRVYDEPNQRSSHSRPKPRGGGLAVVPVILVTWIAAALATDTADDSFWRIVGGALLLAAISWADDLKSRPASLRFGLQVAAVTLGLWGLAPTALVFQGVLPLPLDRLMTALLWLWFINLFNFMDGIDGLTAVETTAISGGLALAWVAAVQAPVTSFAAAVPAAAALGFLYWNWAPSRLFLGDVGSVPLGYLLGWLLIAMALSGLWEVALILPLYYLADASWTLARRALSVKRPWRPHREHFYQRAVQRGFSHDTVAWRIATCNAILVILAVVAAFAPAGRSWIALVLALLAVIALLFILARQKLPAPRSESAPPTPRE